MVPPSALFTAYLLTVSVHHEDGSIDELGARGLANTFRRGSHPACSGMLSAHMEHLCPLSPKPALTPSLDLPQGLDSCLSALQASPRPHSTVTPLYSGSATKASLYSHSHSHTPHTCTRAQQHPGESLRPFPLSPLWLSFLPSLTLWATLTCPFVRMVREFPFSSPPGLCSQDNLRKTRF